MTDKETLILYRLRQARETLNDARLMSDQGASPRSIINRAYYVMFYSVLALIKSFEIRIKSSSHSRVIGIFDQEFVHAGKIEVKFSRSLHKAFEIRLKADYKELIDPTREDAAEHL
jgi:uncharacterized protein